MKNLEVVAGIIENDGKILCTQRGLDKYGYVSYMWEFPGGKIEPNETQEEALIREIDEELCMDIDIVCHFFDTVYSYPDLSISMHCFICKTQNCSPKLNVHNDYKWLSLDELKTLNWAYADRAVVENLLTLDILD